MSAGGKIMFILFLVVIAGFALYLYNSGVLVTLSNKVGSLMVFPSSTRFSMSSTGPTLPSIEPTPTPSGGSSTPPSNIPAGYTASQLSPYYGEVRFGGMSAGSLYSYGQITLNSAIPNGQTVDITGWQIKSKNGGEFIPRAVALYDPSGLTPASDIVLKTSDVVYLFSTSAPINLRLNECMGYIAHMATFVPALPVSCPQIDRSAIQNFTGECQNYIQSISSCQAPNMSDPRIPRNDYACQNYLQNNFTYKSCFNEHVNDPNFLSNQVWVWMGGNVINQYHDTVTLLDKNGLLVDVYSY